MNDNSDLLPNLVHEDAFEMQMRGYSRRQVDEFIARCRSQIRDLEQRLARALDDGEELRRDLATARQQALGANLVGLLLGVVALAGDVFVGLGLLGPGLVVGQLEYLGDALADFLVRGLGAERLLARRGQVPLEFLVVVKGTGKSLF